MTMEGIKEEKIKLWDEVPGYDFIKEIDIPKMHSWFLDGTHSVPPWTPLYGWFWVRYCSHGTKYAAAELSIPTCKGWEMRFRDGGSYNAFHIVRDEKEIAEREIKFREALRPYIEDFDGLWESHKKELLGIYNKLKELDVENAKNIELYHHNYDLIQAYIRMWEIHFFGIYSSFTAWLLFEQLCKERFGIKDQDPEFQDMMRGFDNKVYQMDKKLWEFGQLTIDMGLEALFKENKPQEILAKLQQTERGKEWFKQFMNYLKTDDVGGWRMRRMNELLEPYWLEDPSTPVGVVKDFVTRGAEYVLDDVRKELVRRRETAIASFLQKVPPDEKDFFEGLIRLAGKASSYSEEHNLYCELYVQALMRRGYLAIGRRLAQKGTIDKLEDVFFLNPDEIDRVMMVPEAHDLRLITGRRRAAWEEWQKKPNPPVFTDRGSLEEAVAQDLLPSGDAIAIKIVVGELPEVKPELKADLWGLCGCPGEAEGIARVAMYYEDLKQVQPGEILVCPGTNPAWTPFFGIVKAVVTDRGGTLSHAAIIGREYGVPTVVNTFEATAKIKTGQRIRVDANNGAIYILNW
jgi:phosphohistidine swiveling domain-containing protein